jgi:hypothetical protein
VKRLFVLRVLAPPVIRPDDPRMVCFSPEDGDDKKKAPTRDEQAEAEKKREEEEAEEGVETANDFMRKFLKKSEG